MPSTSNHARTHAAHTKPLDPATNPVHRQHLKSKLPPLPQDPEALARLPQILDFAAMGRTRFYELIGKGLMPAPIKLGRSSFWRVGPLREAVKNLAGGVE